MLPGPTDQGYFDDVGGRGLDEVTNGFSTRKTSLLTWKPPCSVGKRLFAAVECAKGLKLKLMQFRGRPQCSLGDGRESYHGNTRDMQQIKKASSAPCSGGCNVSETRFRDLNVSQTPIQGSSFASKHRGESMENISGLGSLRSIPGRVLPFCPRRNFGTKVAFCRLGPSGRMGLWLYTLEKLYFPKPFPFFFSYTCSTGLRGWLLLRLLSRRPMPKSLPPKHCLDFSFWKENEASQRIGEWARIDYFNFFSGLYFERSEGSGLIWIFFVLPLANFVKTEWADNPIRGTIWD